ncbi:M3 family oligoendopeptidase [Desulfonatronospira thiodismutans]|uniref:M3 family oligoendopeptidase n=1 Tax=Desulfonatronospira thiodismutans TaxID=488939 RepID=UPI001375DE3E|nr:M3 family oligoendopeptidase [Desulfonatronospira thiodismutans]
MIITFFVVYYLSGIYFNIKKKLRYRKDISYFEQEVQRLEEKYNSPGYFQSLDSQDQKELKDRLQRYRETLTDLKNNPYA